MSGVDVVVSFPEVSAHIKQNVSVSYLVEDSPQIECAARLDPKPVPSVQESVMISQGAVECGHILQVDICQAGEKCFRADGKDGR